MKKLIIIHGDKGGVGKSTLTCALIDLALTESPVCVVEGDVKIADVARRFTGVAGVTGLQIDLARPDGSEDAAISLFGSLESAGAPATVIVNLPASASGTIDTQSSIICAAAQEMGYDVRVGWLLGPGEDSARLAGTSAICAAADRKVAVYNGAFGAPDRAAWLNHASRAEWKKTGGLESIMPALAARVMSDIRDMPGRYSDLATAGSGLTIISRQVIKNWLRSIQIGPGRLLLEDKIKETDHD
jgi:hypothetical protein